MGNLLDVEELRAKLTDEYRDLRKSLDEVRIAMDDVDRAGPRDDIYGRLEKLEDTVHKARTGGIFGSGAKAHRDALEAVIEAEGGRKNEA